MVCSPDPLPTLSCLSWLAGMVKTVCWEPEAPEWIFSIPEKHARRDVCPNVIPCSDSLIFTQASGDEND